MCQKVTPPLKTNQEVDERNSKLLQTLSEATDMLAKADEMQVPASSGEGFMWMVTFWLTM